MKKIFAGFLVLTSLFLLVGCEKKDPTKGRVIPAGQNYKMQIWTAEEGDAIEALGREFISASKAAGLQIKVVKFSSEEFLQKTLLDQMAEGKGPDVVFTTGEWIYKNKNKLVPLTQSEGFTADRFAATFVTSAGEAMVQNGEIYGVPIAVDSLGIIYNEDHLISRLLDRNSPGETWQEFRQDTEKLTKQDNSITRFTVSGAAIGRTDNLNYGFEILENIMLQMGTKFFTPEGLQAKFASSVGVLPNGQRKNFGEEAVNFFTSFAKPQYKNYSWNELLASKDDNSRDFKTFLQGKVSMIFGYSRDLAKLKQMLANWNIRDKAPISEKNIRVDFFPQMENSTKLVVANVLGFAVPKTAPHPNLSWKMLKYLAKKEVATSFHNATKLPTARLDLIVEQSAEPDYGFFVRQAKFAKNNFFPIPREEVKKSLSALIQEIVNKKATDSLKYLKNLEMKFNKKLKEYEKLQKLIQRPVKKTPPQNPAKK